MRENDETSPSSLQLQCREVAVTPLTKAGFPTVLCAVSLTQVREPGHFQGCFSSHTERTRQSSCQVLASLGVSTAPAHSTDRVGME